MILFRLDTLERELPRDRRLEKIEKEVVANHSDTSQLRLELQQFSRDILKTLSKGDGGDG